MRVHDVEASLRPAGVGESTWSVPLGVGSAAPESTSPLRIASLRLSRSAGAKNHRRIWIEPEDDIPVARDALMRFRDSIGLAPGQVSVAPTLVAALTEVLGNGDLLLSTRKQAHDLGLHWRPLSDVALHRGYVLGGPRGSDIARVSGLLNNHVWLTLREDGEVVDETSRGV